MPIISDAALARHITSRHNAGGNITVGPDGPETIIVTDYAVAKFPLPLYPRTRGKLAELGIEIKASERLTSLTKNTLGSFGTTGIPHIVPTCLIYDSPEVGLCRVYREPVPKTYPTYGKPGIYYEDAAQTYLRAFDIKLLEIFGGKPELYSTGPLTLTYVLNDAEPIGVVLPVRMDEHIRKALAGIDLRCNGLIDYDK